MRRSSFLVDLLIVVLMLICLIAALKTGAEPRIVACRLGESCDPPATFTSTTSLPPFNSPVRFHRAITRRGWTMWEWTKTVETRCTPSDRKAGVTTLVPEQPSDNQPYERACSLAIGEVLYRTLPFKIVDN